MCLATIPLLCNKTTISIGACKPAFVCLCVCVCVCVSMCPCVCLYVFVFVLHRYLPYVIQTPNFAEFSSPVAINVISWQTMMYAISSMTLFYLFLQNDKWPPVNFLSLIKCDKLVFISVLAATTEVLKKWCCWRGGVFVPVLIIICGLHCNTT